MKKLSLRIPLALLAGFLLTVPIVLRYTPEGIGFNMAWTAGAVWLLLPLLLSFRRMKPQIESLSAGSWKETLPEIILVLFVLGYLFTGVTAHTWFYFQQWAPSSKFNPLHSGPVSLFMLTSFFWTLLLLLRRDFPVDRLLIFLVIGTQALAFFALLAETKGLPLYRDDHPSFMFRLWAFSSIFPRLTSYTPYWNGGVMEGVITKTGITAPGIMLWPLWKYAAIERIYTPAIGFLYIVAVPWLTAFSLRLMRLSWTAALTGCVLGGAISLFHFLWFLHFGTIGANLSSAFVLPVCACLYRIFVLDDSKIITVLLLALSAYFLMLWPPGIIMLFFVLSGLLFHLRRLSWRKTGFLLLAGAIAALLYLPHAVIILQGSKLLKFVTEAGGGGGGSAGTRPAAEFIFSGLSVLRGQILRANPLLVVLGVGGLVTLRERSTMLWLVPIITLFAMLAGWGNELLPNLQLSRMVIPLLFLLIIPAAVTLDSLFRLPGRPAMPLCAVLMALLLLTGLNEARIYANKSPAPYVTMSPKVETLVETIRHEVPPGDRVLFAGQTVHAYGRGHVAFLPAMTGREMMSCDYYAFPPELVEPNYPPRKYRQTKDDTFRFMDVYNVSLVVTYHKNWRDYFLRQPERYKPLRIAHKKHDYSVFRLIRPPSSVLFEGEGTVEAKFNVIRVKPAPGQDKIVLRYNWNDSLKVENGPALIRPRLVWKDIRFVEVELHGAAEVVIRHNSWL